jgi:large subunit ribosomal protein L9
VAKVLMLKDVPKVGQRGDIKEVKDGFFRNFLLPRKLALIATRDVIKKREQELASKEGERKKIAEEASKEFSKLKDLVLSFEEKANKKGSLYKAVSEKDIAAKLSESGIKIEEDWVKIKNPLKEAGEHEVDLVSPFGDKAKLKIEIKSIA